MMSRHSFEWFAKWRVSGMTSIPLDIPRETPVKAISIDPMSEVADCWIRRAEPQYFAAGGDTVKRRNVRADEIWKLSHRAPIYGEWTGRILLDQIYSDYQIDADNPLSPLHPDRADQNAPGRFPEQPILVLNLWHCIPPGGIPTIRAPREYIWFPCGADSYYVPLYGRLRAHVDIEDADNSTPGSTWFAEGASPLAPAAEFADGGAGAAFNSWYQLDTDTISAVGRYSYQYTAKGHDWLRIRFSSMTSSATILRVIVFDD